MSDMCPTDTNNDGDCPLCAHLGGCQRRNPPAAHPAHIVGRVAGAALEAQVLSTVQRQLNQRTNDDNLCDFKE